MNKKSILITIIPICLLMFGCSSSQTIISPPPKPSSAAETSASVLFTPEPVSSMADLLKITNTSHKAVQKPSVNFEHFIHDFSENDFDMSAYIPDGSNGYGADYQDDAVLTADQAREDIEVLFNSLQSSYGAYYYFGGDDAFESAKEAILKQCDEQKELTSNQLMKLLLEHLAFIQDGHFSIFGLSTGSVRVPYIYKDTAFLKTDRGFCTADLSKEVVSVDGWQNLDDLFQMSVADDGSVIYYPVVMQELGENTDAYPKDLLVNYSDGSQQALTTTPYQSYYDDSDKQVELHENQGIPVLFVRNMGFHEAQNDRIGKEFLSYARQLKDEPILILDLRSNGGGNTMLSMEWLQTYTQQPVTTNYTSIKYWSHPDMLAFAENTDNQYYSSYESMTEIGGIEPISEHYMKSNAQPDQFYQNDQLLIILTGKNTASAAETFVDMAHNIENTLIIGESTYGMMVSNAYVVIELPNTHIPVQFGCDLSFFPEDENYYQEFTGLKPDIWVEAKEAEDLAIKLIQNLGLPE